MLKESKYRVSELVDFVNAVFDAHELALQRFLTARDKQDRCDALDVCLDSYTVIRELVDVMSYIIKRYGYEG